MIKIKKIVGQKGFIYGAVILGASMVVVKLIGALFKIPLLNILGESGMAYFSSAYTIFTTVYAFAVTGLTTAVARIIAEKKAQGRYKDIKLISKLSFSMFFGFGIVTSILLFATSSKLAHIINSPKSAMSIMVIAPAVLLCCIMASYRGYYEGLNNMIPTAISQIIEAVVKLFAGLFFANIPFILTARSFSETQTSFGIAVETLEEAYFVAVPYASAGAMLGITLSTAVGVLYLFVYNRFKHNQITKDMLKSSQVSASYKQIFKQILVIALPITLCAVVMQLSSLIDMVTIMNRLEVAVKNSPQYFQDNFSQYLSKNETYHEFLFGIYSACVTLFNLVPAFTSLIGKSAIPVVTKAWADNDIDGLRSKIGNIIKTTFIVSAPSGIGLCAVASPILLMLFSKLGGAVTIGVLPLCILGLASVVFSLINPLNAIFQSINDVYSPIRVIFFSAIIKMVLNFVLVANPVLNITGCAIATLISYLFAVCYSLFILNKSKVCGGIKIQKLKLNLSYVDTFLLPIVGACLCGATARMVYSALIKLQGNSVSLVCGIAFGGGVYILFMTSMAFFKKNTTLPSK